jgi:hypothetical protein
MKMAKVLYYRQNLIEANDFEIVEGEERYIIYAILSLTGNDINKMYILNLIRQLYENYYHEDKTYSSELRKAICHIDHLLYRPEF